MADRTETISIRLDRAVLSQLQEQADRYNTHHPRKKLSRGDYAKRLVLTALVDAEQRQHFEQEFSEIRVDLVRLREDLATLAIALLTQQKPYNLDEAKRWVRDKLLR